MELEVVWKAGAALGEGPIWYDNQLYWVDIEAKRLHIYHPKTDKKETFQLPGKVGTVVPRKSGGVVLGMENGFALFNPTNERLTPLPNPPAETLAGRFNDGKCDPQGRIWCGTMASRDGVAIGSLYRLDADFQCEIIQNNIGCSNGLTWSKDQSTFYYIDSFKNQIEAYDFDADKGEIDNLRIIREEPRDEGLPVFDGMTIDTEGRLWVARWAGSCVQCIDPDTGKVLEQIDVPVRKVTACWFGGDDLGDLYITCASIDETEEQLKEQPEAGSLFRCRPGVKGLPAVPFEG
jgi:sugar lactone lactonase YvrE